MKRLFILLITIALLIGITGCAKGAPLVVEEYLNKYNSLDEDIINNINEVTKNEDLTKEELEDYKAIFKRQYANMEYEITKESYDGDEAIITTKITVYDLYKVQKEASDYLVTHQEDFLDENGNYDTRKFIDYKIKQMKDVKERINYTIDFYVINESSGWRISSLSNSDLEKIHGIYDYES